MPIYGEMTHTVIDSLRIFYLAEMMGFKVITYGTKNLLPFLSLISHEAVVCNTDIESSWNYVEGASIVSDFPWQHFKSSYFSIDFHSNNSLELPVVSHVAQHWRSDVWFCYEGNLVGSRTYPYYELLNRSQYYPTTQNLIDFFKNRKICILESSWDDIKEIEELDIFGHKKGCWFEHKKMDSGDIGFGMDVVDKVVELVGSENVIYDTIDKKLQKWVLQNMADSYLSLQFYCSLVLGVRFSCSHGAGTFMGGIPHLNCNYIFGAEGIPPMYRSFKQQFNKEMFGQECYIYDVDNSESMRNFLDGGVYVL